MQHRDLALMLMRLASEGCWILEIGSFIGNSAVTWVKATRAAALASATVVTMDSCMAWRCRHVAVEGRMAWASLLGWQPTAV